MMPAVTDEYITMGHLRVHYQVAGNGPSLLLIHGLGASHAWWQPNIEALAHCYRVFVPDLPGHGFSDKRGITFSLDWAAQFLKDFMERLGIEQAAVVGQSLGGLIAFETALAWPEKFRAVVAVDSAGLGKEVNLLLRLLTVPLLGELMSLPTALGVSTLMKTLFHEPNQLPPRLAEQMLEERRRPGVKRVILNILRSGVALRGLLPGAIVLDRLKQFRIPTLIIWGEKDEIVSVEHAYAAHRLLHRSEIHIIPACGHCPQLEKPDEFNQTILGFLQRSGNPSGKTA